MTSHLEGLVRELARKLFTNGNNEHGDSLRLVDKSGRYLGGWCEQAVVDQISSHLYPIVKENERLREIVDAIQKFEIALQQHRATAEGSPLEDKRAFSMIVEWVAVQQLLAALSKESHEA